MATAKNSKTNQDMNISEASTLSTSPAFKRDYLKRHSTTFKGMPCEEPFEFYKFCTSKNNGDMGPCLVEWKNFKACHYDTEKNIDRITL
mmetsp:Transcript_8198/g.11266  ORF Transcript_8198/g.11266 Transcript_8198/m.11266 type:complete len:89 (+) Transcript_8198:121-387(+)